MLRVAETRDTLEIESTLPAGTRVLFLLLALFPLLAPYDLILRPGWHSDLNVPFFFAALVSLGALAVSALLAWAALAGLDARTRFDRRSGLITHSVRAPVLSRRTARYPLASLGRLEIQTHDWSDGPPSYSLRMILEDGRAIDSGSSWSRNEIEGVRRRVSAFAGLPA